MGNRIVGSNPTFSATYMRILSIETSCDETALSIIDAEGDFASADFHILVNKTISQIDIHKEYGGVFPAVAKREHAKALVPLLIETLKEAGLYIETSRHVIEHPLRKEFQDILEREPQLFAQFIEHIPFIDIPKIDAIAVTVGPGLEPALWVGINFAKALSLIWKIPVIPINHMEGHLLSSLLSSDKGHVTIPAIEFPALALLVSGGHTELVLMRAWNDYQILGRTKDDAVGEAFDKVARLLGLPYPGGPQISKLALTGHKGAQKLPRPMLTSKDYDFSFAGLKTAARYLIAKFSVLEDQTKADIAREFQDAAVEVLVKKSARAGEEYGAKTFIVGGGVSANTYLREEIARVFKTEKHMQVFLPDFSLSTDNALMIALAGYLKSENARMGSDLRAQGGSRIDQSHLL